MKDSSLARAIYQVSNIRGTFRLRSGQVSDEYFDKYLFESRPELLRRIGQAMKDLIPSGTQILAGLEMGGIPVAVALSLETGLPAIFVRKKAKEYGTAKIAEGMSFSDKEVLIVEDVVTTGGAILDAARALRGEGAQLAQVICVIDREAGGPEKLAAAGLRLSALFTASELRTAAVPPHPII